MLVSGAMPSLSMGLRGYIAESISITRVPPGAMKKRSAPAMLGESIRAYIVSVSEPFGGRSNQNEVKRGNSSGPGKAGSTAQSPPDSPTSPESPPTAHNRRPPQN